MEERQIIVNILTGNIFFVQQHQRGGLQDVFPVVGAQGEVIQIGLCCHKNIFNFTQRIKMNMMIPLRFSDQPQIDFIFTEKLESVIGGLTFNSDPDMGMLGNKFLQIRKEHIFAQGSGDADMKMSDPQIIDLL